MRDHSPPSNLFDSHLLNKPGNRMKRAPRLERPDFLEILAFEEQPEPRRRLGVPTCFRILESRRIFRQKHPRIRRAGDGVERPRRYDRRAVDVWAYLGVRAGDGAGQ